MPARHCLRSRGLSIPMAPHFAEELWELSGESGTLVDKEWIKWDESTFESAEVTIPVRVNSRVRNQISLSAGADEETARRNRSFRQPGKGIHSGAGNKKLRLCAEKTRGYKSLTRRKRTWRKTQAISEKKVKAIEVSPEKPISRLLEEMAGTGFQGKNLGRVVDVLCKMVEAEDLTIFFGYAGSLSTTGQWKIINWLIENRYIDVLIPTGANISEDIVEAMGFSYWQGNPNEDDSKLFSEGINRYHDIYGNRNPTILR